MAQPDAHIDDRANHHVNHGEQNRHHGTSAVKVHLWIRSSNFWSYSVMLFLLQPSCAILSAPSPRLLEMAVCRQYFESHDPKGIPPDGNIRESSCKGPEIQRTFVFMLSAISMCTNLAGDLEILYPQAFVS
jgi:hypothetical protein